MANKCEYDAADEVVFANPELLLEATKFNYSNVNDVELKMKPALLILHQVMFEAQVRHTKDFWRFRCTF